MLDTYWKGVADALNFVARQDAEAEPDWGFEHFAMELLVDFAHSRGLQSWEGEVEQESPADYWPVTGGIGLAAAPNGQLLIGWLSEVTTEEPLFYLVADEMAL